MFDKILNSHHAILVEGEPILTLDDIKGEFIEQGIVIDNNPDFIFLSFEKFGIDDSRMIVEMANGAPVKENKKRIIFGFNTITGEAQNALLKILEDPSPSLNFILFTNSANGLLPTLRSRLFVCRLGAELRRTHAEERGRDAEEFINMSIDERMSQIEGMIKEYKDTSNKQSIKNFLVSLHYIFENKLKKENNLKNISVLNATAKALDYLEDKSSSVKVLLESVAIVL